MRTKYHSKKRGDALYLHLGQDTVVTLDEIIGIFDLDTTTVSKSTRNYLTNAEKAGDVVNVSMELPKSFIVCASHVRPSGRMIYISQISSTTLLKRTEFMDKLANI